MDIDKVRNGRSTKAAFIGVLRKAALKMLENFWESIRDRVQFW